MKIATFNINNVNKRLANLLAYKAVDSPRAAIEKAAYGAVWRGQNLGTASPFWRAALSRSSRRRAYPGTRYIEAAAVKGVLITLLYAPNGNRQRGPKFTYKLAWMDRLTAQAAELFAAGVPVVLAGDYNVVPTDRDIYPTKSYDKDALVQPEARERFRELLGRGWRDAIRTLHPDAPMYTYWSYLRNRWPRDAGLRIDHLLLSKEAGSGSLSPASIARCAAKKTPAIMPRSGSSCATPPARSRKLLRARGRNQ